MNKLNKRETHKVVDIKHLTNSTFIIYIERKNIVFKPGQYIVLGIKGNNDFRQYSIYSGTNEKYLSILVKEVENGELSPLLKHLETGNEVEIEGPMGHFSISNNHKGGIVMIASGTGIAPFHSFVVSNPNANYKLIHGIVITSYSIHYTKLYDCDSRYFVTRPLNAPVLLLDVHVI